MGGKDGGRVLMGSKLLLYSKSKILKLEKNKSIFCLKYLIHIAFNKHTNIVNKHTRLQISYHG